MKPPYETILGTISGVVADITREWGMDASPAADTRLNADLGFTSMDVMDLFATLEMKFERKLPYESFLTGEDGSYRRDLTIGELVGFVNANLDTPRPDSTLV